MPVTSEKQWRFMQAIENTPESELKGPAKKAKKSLSKKQLHDFTASKPEDLPEKAPSDEDKPEKKASERPGRTPGYLRGFREGYVVR